MNSLKTLLINFLVSHLMCWLVLNLISLLVVKFVCCLVCKQIVQGPGIRIVVPAVVKRPTMSSIWSR